MNHDYRSHKDGKERKSRYGREIVLHRYYGGEMGSREHLARVDVSIYLKSYIAYEIAFMRYYV
jgi:hypothetical protein